MARKTTSENPKKPDALIISKEEFIAKLLERIKIGKELYDKNITNIDELERAEKDYIKWDDYNVEFLKNSFNNEDNEYRTRFQGVDMKIIYTRETPEKRLQEHKTDTENKINYLETLIEKTELIKSDVEVKEQSEMVSKTNANEINKENIFIVHGHNNDILQSVARTIEKLGLKPIILHEQPNAGRTIIEKFEGSSAVGFAVVLLTDDDEGKSKTEIDLKKRARQNVVLELGYFIAKLGRSNVLPLYSEGVEIPSDIHGLLYVPIDKANSWKFTLAKELKEAGYNIDANLLM